jgi:hypothetical protein
MDRNKKSIDEITTSTEKLTASIASVVGLYNAIMVLDEGLENGSIAKNLNNISKVSSAIADGSGFDKFSDYIGAANDRLQQLITKYIQLKIQLDLTEESASNSASAFDKMTMAAEFVNRVYVSAIKCIKQFQIHKL